MKRILLTFWFFILVGFALLISCRKHEAFKEEEKLSTVTTIYERPNPAEIDTSIWADHVTRVEMVTRNDGILDKYKLDNTWTQFVAQNIDTSKPILRYTYDNSLTQLITIPLKTNHKREVALVYASRDTFMFATCIVDSLINTNFRYVYKPIGTADIYYGFELTSDNYIGNFQFGVDMPLYEVFGNRVGPTCRDMYPTQFGKCMKCSLDRCNSSFWCRLLMSPSMWDEIKIGVAGGWVLGCGG